MLTRHEHEESLGHGALTRIARETLKPDGRPYSLSYVSAVVNTERSGERCLAIEQAVVREINARRARLGLHLWCLSDVFPPRTGRAIGDGITANTDDTAALQSVCD